MRLLALWLTSALLLLSGCMEEEPADDAPADDGTRAPGLDSNGDGIPDTGEDTDGDGVPEPLPPVPEPITFTGSLKGVGSPAGSPPDPVPACPLMQAQCVDHVVTVPAGSWQVTFTLIGSNGMVTSLGVPSGTDYDLFVEGVGESTNPSGQPDAVKGRLSAGDYTAQVLAWHDVDGEYTLTVTFAY